MAVADEPRFIPRAPSPALGVLGVDGDSGLRQREGRVMRACRGSTTPDDPLDRDAVEVQDWLKAVRTRELTAPRDFNWLGLAEATAFDARRHAIGVKSPITQFPKHQQEVLRDAVCLDRSEPAVPESELREWLASALPALAWANAALAAYGYLASRSSVRDRNAYEDSAMNLRAFLISRLGALAGHRVLDATEIVYWFFDNLRMTPREAGERASAWKNGVLNHERAKQVNQMRQLRWIKNRAAILALLVGSGQLEPTPALREWLALREQLP